MPRPHIAPAPIRVRPYRAGEAGALIALFRATVHAVNIRDYSAAQVNAWAPEAIDEAAWAARLAAHDSFVAEAERTVVGFIELAGDGMVHMLYCHRDWQGRGVGAALLARVEARARRLGLRRLATEASITARPFFQARGFRVIAEQQVRRRCATFVNYRM